MKKLVAILLILALCVSVCAQAEETWTCPNCGRENTDALCSNCGAEKPFAAQVGDTVTFGSWGGEPIEWQVMEVKEDGSCVLLSVKGLDAKPYNAENAGVTWETCTLRAWLNGEFYETAFSASEKDRIVLSTVENPDNKKYGTEGGNTTQDYVFLLSLDEVGRYFNVDPYNDGKSAALTCYPTEYAKNNGADTDIAGACWWWLRSPDFNPSYAAGFGRVSFLYVEGSAVNAVHSCVRPVICVRF